MLSSFVYGRLRSFDRNPPGSDHPYALRHEIELGGIESSFATKLIELPDPSLGRRTAPPPPGCTLFNCDGWEYYVVPLSNPESWSTELNTAFDALIESQRK